MNDVISALLLLIMCIIVYHYIYSFDKENREYIYIRTDKKDGFKKNWNRYGLKRLFIFASINGTLEHMTNLGYYIKVKESDFLKWYTK